MSASSRLLLRAMSPAAAAGGHCDPGHLLTIRDAGRATARLVLRRRGRPRPPRPDGDTGRTGGERVHAERSPCRGIDSTIALATAISAHAGNATLLRQARPGRARRVHAIATFATSQPATAAAIAMSVPQRVWTRRNVGRTAAVSAAAVSAMANSCVSSRNRRAGSRGGWSIAPAPWLGDECYRRADVHEQLQDTWGRGERGCPAQSTAMHDTRSCREVNATARRSVRRAATTLTAPTIWVCVVDEHEIGRLRARSARGRPSRSQRSPRRGRARLDAVAGDAHGSPLPG